MYELKFEIFGKVQGVFFRKFTQEKARSLNLIGWVENTSHGSVRGVAQGDYDKLAEFQKWLKETGSPKSKIERLEYELQPIEKFEFKEFVIKR